MVDYLYHESRDWFGSGSGFRRKGVELVVVGGDEPSHFGLSVAVADQYVQFGPYPLVGVDVAAFPSH